MDAQETTTTEAEALSQSESDSTVTVVCRKRELTPKALEEKLNGRIRSMRGKLGQLTAKLNDMEHLLSNEEESVPYERIYQEFIELNSSVLLYLRNSSPQNDSQGEMYRLIQRQTDIAEMLVKYQECSRDVPVFSGEPLEFISFMRAFNHVIDARADSSADKLFFLEQYTRGEPQDRVKSCRGYAEAVRLLHECYGDPQRIADALVNKAHKWPVIKSEEGKALSAFSVFLVSCRKALEDVDFMEGMDSLLILRAIVAKLPFSMRERWRVQVYELQKRSDQRRAKFTDLVNFVDRQAKLSADKKDTKKHQQGKKEQREAKRGSSFVTSAEQVDDEKGESSKSKDATYINRAFTKPCVFCEKDHILEECGKLREKLHKEIVEFLKKNGFCFGCLVKGHLRKECKKKITLF